MIGDRCPYCLAEENTWEIGLHEGVERWHLGLCETTRERSTGPQTRSISWRRFWSRFGEVWIWSNVAGGPLSSPIAFTGAGLDTEAHLKPRQRGLSGDGHEAAGAHAATLALRLVHRRVGTPEKVVGDERDRAMGRAAARTCCWPPLSVQTTASLKVQMSGT